MEEARRRLQEKQDAKAAKFIEDKMQVSKTLHFGQATILYCTNESNISCIALILVGGQMVSWWRVGWWQNSLVAR